MGSKSNFRSVHEYHIALLKNNQDHPDGKVNNGSSGLQIVASLGMNNGQLATVIQEIRPGEQPSPTSQYLESSNRRYGVVTIGHANNDLVIVVKSVTGKTKEFTIDNTETVDDLMNMVEEEFKVRSCQQKLSYNGKPLVKGHHLDEYELQHKETVYLTFRNRGGGFTGLSKWIGED